MSRTERWKLRDILEGEGYFLTWKSGGICLELKALARKRIGKEPGVY